MHILIYGCTRLTDALAPILVQDGHQLTIVDTDSDRLSLLGIHANVNTVWLTDPLLQDPLQLGGIDTSQAFFSLSIDDHKNLLLCQIASHIYNIPKVMCRLSDPQLQDFYQPRGLSVLDAGPDFLSAAREFLEG